MIELKPLQGQVRALVEDLRGQVAADRGLRSKLDKEYEDAKVAQRTAGTFESWLDDVLDQAAVAWVLGCVFVRFCEDNRLVDGLWLGGPLPEAPVERALQHRQAHVIANPRDNDRHWLRVAFTHLRGLRATGKIFDEHNPVWRFGISGRAAEDLSDFFRRGEGLRSLRSPGLDTRFLGDLYQDLSVHARETYALLQTPVFVEEFILDRTFGPAHREFGLAGTTVIDLTCGSGHFLLGAFQRLVTKWKVREPGTDVRELVQRALHQVTGVDINPFAVAIARFRLMVAALNACGLSSLERAPAFDVRVATGDSLLPWAGEAALEQPDLHKWQTDKPFAYTSEDEDLLADYLKPRQYTVVVGNPPYITVKDKARNQDYRKRYSACSGKYALTVPFAQRFFQLAARGDRDGDGAGYVGQITSNSFMKREFGKKLINEFFAGQVELFEVIDASGAYIPGHGTPPVILVGRNRLVSARYSRPIRIILGVQGESGTPMSPAEAPVWRAIVDQIDQPGSESPFVSCTDAPREQLVSHPWSLSGGGAASLMDALSESAVGVLGKHCSSMGFSAVTGDDSLYVRRSPLSGEVPLRPFVIGDDVRDWSYAPSTSVAFPYSDEFQSLDASEDRRLWLVRTTRRRGLMFGKTNEDRGRSWPEYAMLSRDRLTQERLLVWAFVATANHFALAGEGPVFNHAAPVAAFPQDTPQEEIFSLLGILNSSTACFWLKQVSQPKAGGGVGRGMQDEAWEERYEFTGTKLKALPLPRTYPAALGREADEHARKLASVNPAAVISSCAPTKGQLETAQVGWHAIRAGMIAVQEELDWEVYRLYGLLDEDLTTSDPPGLRLGERAFEILMARNGVETEWFNRHGSTPITELPVEWPDEYKALVERRIAVIESDRNIGLIERPECKRRWATEGWDAMQTRALRDWLLDRLESTELWGGAPTPLSVAQLADRVRHDDDFRSVLDLWVGTDQHDVVKTLGKLVADEHVPFLPAQRYKPPGLRKRAQWERTWALQRQEDAGAAVDIPVPPKYVSADFVKGSYWRNRGKLDVPKERFISYPGLGREGDDTALLGWAGWDHLAQAQALATVYLDRKTQSAWPPARLLPVLAGLAELEPWLRRWHAEPRPGFPATPAQFFTGLIDTELATLGAHRGALTELRGVEELA